MNHSPWYVQHTAEYEQQRIRDDMKQIRLEQKALKAETHKASRPGPQTSAWRAVRHTAAVVTQAILAMLS